MTLILMEINNVTFEHNSFLNVSLKCRLRRGCDIVDRNEGRHRFALEGALGVKMS